MAKTAMASAKISSGSSPSAICIATSKPRISASRTRRPGRSVTLARRTSRISCPAISGSSTSTTKFGWALACEIIAGANPQNRPPMTAAVRELTSSRENSQYQANAVALRPRVRTNTKVTVGPNNRVTGVNGTPTPNMAVLAIMFTPAGKFCRFVPSGFSRFATVWAVTAKNHSHMVWSWPLLIR